MTDDVKTTADADLKGSTVSLEVLAKMTGFPLEMITEEVFQGKQKSDEVSLEDLRSAMLSFIDSTMMVNDRK